MEGGSCYSFPSSQSVYQDRLFLWQLFYPTFQSHQFLLPAPHIHQICVFLLLLVQTRSPHFISLPPVGCVISLSVHLIFSFHLTSSSQFKLNQFNQLPSPVTPLQELVFSSEKDCRKTKENFLRVIPLGEFFYMTESNEFHYFSCIKLSIFFKEHHINKKVVERLGFLLKRGVSCISGAGYLFLGNVWGQCSSQRDWWLFCSSAGWHCWAAALTARCSLVMPLRNGEWSCKDMWTWLQSRPPLPPAGQKSQRSALYWAFGWCSTETCWGSRPQEVWASPNKWMHWKVYYYMSPVLRDFSTIKRGLCSALHSLQIYRRMSWGLCALMKQ